MPMAPPAPPRLSTTTGCATTSDRLREKARARTSLGPPAEKGTTRRICFCGQVSSAIEREGKVAASRTAATSAQRCEKSNFMRWKRREGRTAVLHLAAPDAKAKASFHRMREEANWQFAMDPGLDPPW